MMVKKSKKIVVPEFQSIRALRLWARENGIDPRSPEVKATELKIKGKR
jgi:hypothetical protein